MLNVFALFNLEGTGNDVPEEHKEIAEGLPYRDYMTVGVLIPKLNLKNETKTKTIGNIVPDNWVYVHDKNVKMGRFQNPTLTKTAAPSSGADSTKTTGHTRGTESYGQRFSLRTSGLPSTAKLMSIGMTV